MRHKFHLVTIIALVILLTRWAATKFIVHSNSHTYPLFSRVLRRLSYEPFNFPFTHVNAYVCIIMTTFEG